MARKHACRARPRPAHTEFGALPRPRAIVWVGRYGMCYMWAVTGLGSVIVAGAACSALAVVVAALPKSGALVEESEEVPPPFRPPPPPARRETHNTQ